MSTIEIAGYNEAGNMRSVIGFDEDALLIAIGEGADPKSPESLFGWFARRVAPADPMWAPVDLSIYTVFTFFTGEDNYPVAAPVAKQESVPYDPEGAVFLLVRQGGRHEYTVKMMDPALRVMRADGVDPTNKRQLTAWLSQPVRDEPEDLKMTGYSKLSDLVRDPRNIVRQAWQSMGKQKILKAGLEPYWVMNMDEEVEY